MGKTVSVAGKEYLFGTIIRKERKQGEYTVEWEHSSLGISTMPLTTLYDGIQVAEAIEGARRVQDRVFPITPALLHQLTYVVDADEKGIPLESEDEEEDNIDSDNAESNNEMEGRLLKKGDIPIGNLDVTDLVLPSLVSPRADEEVVGTAADGLQWKSNMSLAPPINVSSGRKTELKSEHRMRFVNPLSSFTAFLPIEFWKLYLYRTNTNGEMKYNAQVEECKIQGREYHGRIWRDITLKEFMTFFGILIDMALRPTPGQRYTNRWQCPDWHPYTARMQLQRFIQIRAALYMCAHDDRRAASTNDALFKVRPMLNVLKKTLGSYVNPGSDLSLDESSIACRSKYGRSLIFYNNTKPCGKYHFRFYIVTDTEAFMALRLRVHTRNDSDNADGYAEDVRHNNNSHDWADDEEEEATREEEQHPKLVRLIHDMARPWFNTGRVMNMDNYYVSVQAFLELRKNGLYARGTCRPNRRHFPAAVLFSRTEAKAMGRGAMKIVSNKQNGIVAMGWVDGNPVHFLTTADGTEASTVKRRVGSVVETVKAPAAIRRFNHGMQGVDRFDQLVSLFSLAKQHAFKKYYNKLAMGLLDFALVNAELHYFLVNPREKEKGDYRYQFRVDLCKALYETDWNNFSEEGAPVFGGEQPGVQARVPPAAENTPTYTTEEHKELADFTMAPAVILNSPTSDWKQCDPIGIAAFLKRNNKSNKGLSYGGSYCQVCLFEGRSKHTRNVVICRHGIRSCSVSRASDETALSRRFMDARVDWMCPKYTASCLEKLHHHYIPLGLFGKSPRLSYRDDGTPATVGFKRSCRCYQDKMKFLVDNNHIDRAPSLGGRKRKTDSTSPASAAAATTTTTTKRKRKSMKRKDNTNTSISSVGQPKQQRQQGNTQKKAKKKKKLEYYEMPDYDPFGKPTLNELMEFGLGPGSGNSSGSDSGRSSEEERASEEEAADRGDGPSIDAFADVDDDNTPEKRTEVDTAANRVATATIPVIGTTPIRRRSPRRRTNKQKTVSNTAGKRTEVGTAANRVATISWRSPRRRKKKKKMVSL